MQPEPLLGKLADPSLDHGSDRLHGACDLNASGRIADRLDRGGNFAPETVAVGFAHDAHAVDRQFGLAREHRYQRICKTAPPEKYDLNALAVVLVGQHADMDASFQKPR